MGSISIISEIYFVEEEPDSNGAKNWLHGSGRELSDKINTTSGLTLEISTDGSFVETKDENPEIYWFRNKGVLTSEIVPFNRRVKVNEFVFFLQPDEIPSWAAPTDKYGAILRYDDGGTKICDRLFPLEIKLIRTINVVTDELYLGRIIAVDQRV